MATTDAKSHEPHANPEILAGQPDSKGVSYAPIPSQSLEISLRRKKILNSICALYSGSASETDMLVYAADAIYDDPLSYCDDRYKIAGQWYGIPKLFSKSTTLKTEVVASSDDKLVFKLRQEYVLKGGVGKKTVDSLVSLGLGASSGGEEVVKYHKDQWNEKDYSHQGVGFLFKKMNGDFLTGITKPPKDL